MQWNDSHKKSLLNSAQSWISKKLTYRTVSYLFFFLNVLNYFERAVIPGAGKEIEKFVKIFHPTRFDTFVGLLQSAYIIGYTVAGFVFGYLVTVRDSFKMVCLGLTIWLLAITLSGSSWNYVVFFVARLLSGVGEASFQMVVPAFIDDFAPALSVGPSMSLLYAAIPVGTALGYVIAGYTSESFSWRVNYFVLIPIIAPFIVFMYIYPHKRIPHRFSSNQSTIDQEMEVKIREPPVHDLKHELSVQMRYSVEVMSTNDDVENSWNPNQIIHDNEYMDVLAIKEVPIDSIKAEDGMDNDVQKGECKEVEEVEEVVEVVEKEEETMGANNNNNNINNNNNRILTHSQSLPSKMDRIHPLEHVDSGSKTRLLSDTSSDPVSHLTTNFVDIESEIQQGEDGSSKKKPTPLSPSLYSNKPSVIWSSILELLKRKTFLLAVTGEAIVVFVTIGFTSFCNILLLGVGMFDSMVTCSLVVGVSTIIAGIAGSLIGGWSLKYQSKKYAHLSKIRAYYAHLVFFGFGAFIFLFFTGFLTWNRNWFFLLFGIGTSFMIATNPSMTLVVLHASPDNIRPFAMGISSIIYHALGDVPSPIVVGAFLDVVRSWAGDDKQKYMYGCKLILQCVLLFSGVALFLWTVGYSYVTIKERRIKQELGLDEVEVERVYDIHSMSGVDGSL